MTLPVNLEPILRFVLVLLGAYAVLLLMALVMWTVRDVRSRTRDVFAQILAALLVLIFNLPGLLLYFVLRPRTTLSEAYEQALGQEALLQDIEERYICPSCRHKAKAEYLRCPSCGEVLRKRCIHCGQIINLNWAICPYCGEEQQPTDAMSNPQVSPQEPTRQ